MRSGESAENLKSVRCSRYAVLVGAEKGGSREAWRLRLRQAISPAGSCQRTLVDEIYSARRFDSNTQAYYYRLYAVPYRDLIGWVDRPCGFACSYHRTSINQGQFLE